MSPLHWERVMFVATSGSHLQITESDSDLLVYDDRHNHVHVLNETAAAVWTAAASPTDRQSIATSTGLPLDVVELALIQLSEAALIDGTVATIVDRRALLRRASAAAIAGAGFLPAISSITQSAAAVTCIPEGGPCVLNESCCTFRCSTQGVCVRQAGGGGR